MSHDSFIDQLPVTSWDLIHTSERFLRSVSIFPQREMWLLRLTFFMLLWC